MTIDIIRRDTLAASHAVGSPLQRLTAHYQPGEANARQPGEAPAPEPTITTR